MIKIDSLDQINLSIKRIRDLKKDFLSNFFLDTEKHNLWISLGIFYSFALDETVFFFKKNDTFYNVYFCSGDHAELSADIASLKKLYPDKILVFDLIGTELSLKGICNIFESNGFRMYTSLNRMSRIISSAEEASDNHFIRYAELNDLNEIHNSLFRYFDEYAEQLPLGEELRMWIARNHLLVYVEDKQIIGFTIFDIIGMTSYLRYWFVHPMHRNKKIGSLLLRRFFHEGKNAKRQIFWVIRDNYNAILRYQHYGFKNENLIDYIYINIDKHYESKSD
jgi:ribosomal protein S18 acetylase RimI-like enzyme